MLRAIASKGFEKDLKKLNKKHYNIKRLDDVIDLLVNQLPVPKKYKLHSLKGNLQGYKVCHIESNWLLIFYETEDAIILARTGSHDELFK